VPYPLALLGDDAQQLTVHAPVLRHRQGLLERDARVLQNTGLNQLHGIPGENLSGLLVATERELHARGHRQPANAHEYGFATLGRGGLLDEVAFERDRVAPLEHRDHLRVGLFGRGSRARRSGARQLLHEASASRLRAIFSAR